MSYWRTLSEDGETVTLTRFRGDFRCVPAAVDADGAVATRRLKRGLVIDVETTGLHYKEGDQVIEVGLRGFAFDRVDGGLIEVGAAYEALQEPTVPVPAEVTRLTGLSASDLAGQAIDWARVRAEVEAADVVIAHNARFDREFVDARIGAPKKAWACSLEQVAWGEHGFPVAKLELLTAFHGFFARSHRALADADALLHLLTFRAPDGGRTYLAELLENARRTTHLVRAVDSPLSTKDVLKARGYRWDGDDRVWWREVEAGALDAERAWLTKHVYSGNPARKPKVTEIGPFDRFKARS